MSIIRKLFNTEGRMRRREFWLSQLLLLPFSLLLNLLASVGIDDLSGVQSGLVILGLLFLFVFETIQMIKRFHDTDRSGFSIFLMFIPIVNLGGAYILSFKDGTRGPNQYGPDSKGREPEEDEM
ncbi:MAG: DUF805 domain-containing protein [Bacteroidetes bacterium]|nr:DUF805 domain-containing protein [Bacteroidota bacterium]